MTTINSGYTNFYSTPATATSAPGNFGPGQVKSDNEQTERNQSRVQETREGEKAASAGFTTPTRGSQLTITA